MRIVSSYRGTERVFETPKSEVLFGRPDDKEHIDLDLSPDLKVSRRHGRIWEENGQFWIEDLNSSRGTLLSAVEIKGHGKREAAAEVALRIAAAICFQNAVRYPAADHCGSACRGHPAGGALGLGSARTRHGCLVTEGLSLRGTAFRERNAGPAGSNHAQRIYLEASYGRRTKQKHRAGADGIRHVCAAGLAGRSPRRALRGPSRR